MEIVKTPIEGPLVIKPKIFTDDRGYFFESWSKMAFEKEEPCGYQDETGLVGSEVMLDAPEVDIVDITDVYDDGDEYQEDEEIVLDLTDDIFNNLDMFTETTKQTPIIKQKI